MSITTNLQAQEKVGLQSGAARIALGLVLSALSGGLMLFSFPPYGFWWLMWFACVPYRFAQYRLFPRKWASAAEAVAILVFLGPFMARMFGTDNGPFFQYLGVLIAILIFFIGKESGFHEKTGYRWFILQGMVSWVGVEMIRATFIPLVATSAFIGYTQSTQPWITQPVSIFSVYGMNLVIMLVNYALTLTLMAWSDRKWPLSDAVRVEMKPLRVGWISTAVVLVLWFGISAVLLASMPKDPPTVRVAAVQPGYEKPAFQDEVINSDMRLGAFTADAREAARQGAKIIFTPEMLFNLDPQLEYTDQLRALAAETDAYLVLNYTVSIEGQDWRNEAVILSPSGEFSGLYGKNKIPPGEPVTMTAGVFPVTETPFGNLATMICHDGNYTDIARKLAANGAQLVSAGLNEFGGFGEQYWTNISFRAIENRVAMVSISRATGSAIIQPDGSLAATDLERGKHVVLVDDVRLGSGGTLYTPLGDLLGWASLAGFIGFMLYQIILDNREKKKAKAESIS
ncbi:MAG: hypothetical protein JW750_05165 [Anaerolineaceae bacterium]|nr:hypothetical protein [Anaerolineaceae bacterium]